ncbi:unnamed protein product [Periconia digitata]|uniref:Uncharacterized protein n=1 Tax=Periconia digitata TaxID=1303443 RepID=A0A9W4XRZ7_9PLEO|nr:unnamed protein product [Periconia digitata]
MSAHPSIHLPYSHCTALLHTYLPNTYSRLQSPMRACAHTYIHGTRMHRFSHDRPVLRAPMLHHPIPHLGRNYIQYLPTVQPIYPIDRTAPVVLLDHHHHHPLLFLSSSSLLPSGFQSPPNFSCMQPQSKPASSRRIPSSIIILGVAYSSSFTH